MPKKISASRVVAFNARQEPIRVNPPDWEITLDTGSGEIELRAKKHTVRYDLGRDVLCLAEADSREVAAVGRTLGRMALSGFVARNLVRGGGMGGALLDLTLRGTEKNIIRSGVLVMHDTSVIVFEADDAEFMQISQQVPNFAREAEAATHAQERIELVERMAADGLRALDELDVELHSIEAAIGIAEGQAANGDCFAARDESRRETARLQSLLAERRYVRRAIFHALELERSAPIGEADGANWVMRLPYPIFLLLGALAFFVGGIAGMFLVGLVGALASTEPDDWVALIGFLLGGIAAAYRLKRARGQT